jgi:hypothetical protein
VKRLKVRVRKAYNKRKSGQRYQVEIKRVSKEMLAEKKKKKKKARSVLRNEGNCWSEFYKHVTRRKGNTEIIPAVKDHNGTVITDSTENDNVLNS